MTWNLTLEVTDCGATTTLLTGAKVELGVVELGQTDGAGRFTASLDDFNTLPIFKISKTDYVTGNFRFDKGAHAGTVQTVCLDNPATIPDGHDPDIPGESGGQEFDGGGCFIVTAATGSALSPEVTTLRALRKEIRSCSSLAGQLIDAIYAEYAGFSPPIAAELRVNPVEQMLVLGHVVQPLFAWYTLAATLALTPHDAGAQQAASARLAEARPQSGATLVHDLLEGLRSGAPPTFLPEPLRDLAPRIANCRFATWAILDPLIRIWRDADQPLDARSDIADWLASAPLDLLPQPCSACGLGPELDTLADFLAFAPDRRATLAARLRAAWPAAHDVIERSGLTRRNRT